MAWNNPSPFTDREIEYLKKCHGKVTADDAATTLNRKKIQVYNKMSQMGLRFKTDEDPTPPCGMIWRQSLVPGILASETGLLWSEKKLQLIEPSVNAAGDHFILVQRQPVSVSRIVYEAFYGEIKDNRQVFRKDKDPGNSDIGNLICITSAEARARGMWGIQHPIAVYKNGKRVAVFISAAAAAKAFGVTNQTITSRANGIVPKWANKKSAKMEGYEFRYVNQKKQSANRQDVLARKKRIINDNP